MQLPKELTVIKNQTIDIADIGKIDQIQKPKLIKRSVTLLNINKKLLDTDKKSLISRKLTYWDKI